MPNVTIRTASSASSVTGSLASEDSGFHENFAISRDETSGNDREIENLSAIASQSIHGNAIEHAVERERVIERAVEPQGRQSRHTPSFGDDHYPRPRVTVFRNPAPPPRPPPHEVVHDLPTPPPPRETLQPPLQRIHRPGKKLPGTRLENRDHEGYTYERSQSPLDRVSLEQIPLEREPLDSTNRRRPSREARPDRPQSPSPVRFRERWIPLARNATVTDAHTEGWSDEDDVKPHPQYTTGASSTTADDAHLSVMLRPRTEDDFMDEIERLRFENERLKQEKNTTMPQAAHPASTYKVFHLIDGNYYLDEPQWVPGDDAPSLRANNPIRNVQYYLDQHPDIAFAIYKTYASKAPKDLTKIETKDGVFLAPIPKKQNLSLISPTMIEAIEEFLELVPDFDYFFPYFNPHQDIKAPYLFMYYSTPYIQDILPQLDQTSRHLMEKLDECIQKTHGFEHTSAVLQFAKGRVSKNLFKYLIRPGDVLVNRAGPRTRAYLATDWVKEIPEPDEGRDEDYDEWGEYTREKSARRGVNTYDARKYSWKVPVWSWDFDGRFHKNRDDLVLDMKASDESEIISIDQLNIIPLDYAAPGIRRTLEKRGETFWQLRHQKFISYRQSENGELSSVSDRYMVDIETYKKLHPNSTLSRMRLPSSLTRKEMESDEPPEGNALLLFPPWIPGFHLVRKTWLDLYVDQISDIDWNKQAFKDLVVDDETKELVQALVMKQIEVQKSTDVIQGKGNGLILLLHGGPGTGKTFTAEGVAEFAEKPLLRVTCGDVGTEARVVERRLQSNFHLGKIWDCVVLLDEADVFLEERDMKDLNRNALVSVFLRELEYHDGILILTSNRVGTFDEAFKSRIQLALHYENLVASQRRKIWRNLLTRVKTLDQPPMDFDDIMDHIDELSQVEMNGREIRNSITTARQLAQFKDMALCYSHLKHVIRVSGKFGKYLKDLRDGLTEDDLKRDSGLRLTYKVDNKVAKESPF